MKDVKFKNYDDLPLMLSVPDLTAALGISRAGAYELVKQEGFPSLHKIKMFLLRERKIGLARCLHKSKVLQEAFALLSTATTQTSGECQNSEARPINQPSSPKAPTLKTRM